MVSYAMEIQRPRKYIGVAETMDTKQYTETDATKAKEELRDSQHFHPASKEFESDTYLVTTESVFYTTVDCKTYQREES